MVKFRNLILTLLVIFLLSYKLNQPFWGHHEFNGVFYGMIAKNYIRYGLQNTRGAQITNLYKVSKDIWSFHTNHAATYPLFLSLMFRILGQHEYVLRIVSVFASSAGIVLLARLIDVVFKNKLAWLAVIPIVFTPLFRYYGSLPVFEPILFPIITYGLYVYWTARKQRDYKLLAGVSVLAFLIDWPGFWLPLWILAFEIFFKKRKKLIIALLISIALSAIVIIAHQYLAYANISSISKAGLYRIAASKQPYSLYSWVRLLLSRTRAFWGLPIILGSFIGVLQSFREKKRKAFKMLSLSFAIGISHIVVFRNITWYHDYMFYHLLPFVGLSLAAFISATDQRFRKNFVTATVWLAIVTASILGTNQFFNALADLSPHKDCVLMGNSVRNSTTQITFKLTQEKANECPPFIGYYGEKPFNIEIVE